PPPTLNHYTPSLHDALPILSAATLRLENAQLFTKSRIIPVAIIPVSDSRWTRLRVSLHRVTEKTRQTAAIRTHVQGCVRKRATEDRKSTRLNSSHEWISYAV